MSETEEFVAVLNGVHEVYESLVAWLVKCREAGYQVVLYDNGKEFALIHSATGVAYNTASHEELLQKHREAGTVPPPF